MSNNDLSDNGETFKFGYNSSTDEMGYYKKVSGADTFFPFTAKKELLYDNTAETTNVGAKTLVDGVDSTYDAVIIQVYTSKGISHPTWFTGSILLQEGQRFTVCDWWNADTTYCGARDFFFDETTRVIRCSRGMARYSGGGTYNDGYFIPHRVWGVKLGNLQSS